MRALNHPRRSFQIFAVLEELFGHIPVSVLFYPAIIQRLLVIAVRSIHLLEVDLFAPETDRPKQ